MIDNSDLRLLNIKDEDLVYLKNKQFIVAWQTSKNLAEVARKTGLSVGDASDRASWLRRRHHFPLKRYREKINFFPTKKIKELKALAKSLNPTTELDASRLIKLWIQNVPIPKISEILRIPKKRVVWTAHNLSLAGVPGMGARKHKRQLLAPLAKNIMASMPTIPADSKHKKNPPKNNALSQKPDSNP